MFRWSMCGCVVLIGFAVVRRVALLSDLQMLQCSPTSDGAGAAILASERFVRERGLEGQAVEIVAQTMTTDNEASFDNPANLIGFDMAQRAAKEGGSFACVTFSWPWVWMGGSVAYASFDAAVACVATLVCSV